jgi:cytochrome P450 / NADPH-cytochrome P450 reductase
MSKLPYIEAVMREAIRLYPTAPAFSVQPVPGTEGPVIIGGCYQIPADASIACLVPKIGRDPTVYGADAEEFRPQRMYGENFEKLPPNAWKVPSSS